MTDKRAGKDECFKDCGGDALVVDLWYPQQDGQPKYIDLGLVDVRASDGIRISYDFERDGWVIEQPRKQGQLEEYDPQWKEVSFVQSWGRDD